MVTFMPEFTMQKKTSIYLAIMVIAAAFVLAGIAGCVSPAGSMKPSAEENASISITDADGNTLVLSHPPQRIISISSCAVELLVILGAEDRIVGVLDSQLTTDTILKDHLPNAIPSGSYLTPSVEKIVAIKPDLIITYSGSSKPGNIDQIRNLKVPVVYVDSCMPSTINTNALLLGRIAGTEDKAEKYIAFNNYYRNLIESRLSSGNYSRPRVYIESSEAFNAQGNGTSGDELVSILHGENIVKNLSGTPVVSNEWVISNNPDIIVKGVSEWHGDLPKAFQGIQERPGFSNITAIKSQRVYVYNAPLTVRPRYIITELYLAKQFYPDLFSDIDPQVVLREYAREFLPGSDEIENRDFMRYYPPLAGEK
jgi:iron complex transport system substrate-binding protein